MALVQNLQHELGFILNDVYFRAEHFQGTKMGMVITVRGYANTENANAWANHVYFKAFDFVPEVTDTAENIVKQAYNFLKSLPEFKDAVDA